ncbi:MAG: P-loop NTPase, partial [Candidatus Thermoplasmatota archaeon]|nr:P-loop NTPase [Candidatus Thermoplasmatota archaeon]
GVKLMSLIYFTKDRPLAMRGSNISDAILEIMAITRWGELDYLVIDMPPGIGEETLDVIRLIKRCEFIVVTTQSKVAWEVVKRLLSLFKEMKVKVIGIVENMRLTEAHSIEAHLGEFGYRYLGGLPFDTTLEEAVGNPEKILKTDYGKALKKIAEKL